MIFVGLKNDCLFATTSNVFTDVPSISKITVLSTIFSSWGLVMFPGTMKDSFPSKIFSYPSILSSSETKISPKIPSIVNDLFVSVKFISLIGNNNNAVFSFSLSSFNWACNSSVFWKSFLTKIPK